MGDPKVKVRVKVKVHKPFWQRHPIWFASILFGFIVFMAAVAVVFFSDNKASEDIINAGQRNSLVTLPLDDGPHDVMTEWWYYSGHLETATGRQFSYHYTIFAHRALANHTIIHATLLDQETGITYAYENRIPGFYTQPLGRDGVQINQGQWKMKIINGIDTLMGKAENFSFDLDLNDQHGPVMQDGDGLADFKVAGESYYYSRPRMKTSGQVMVDGQIYTVSGSSWFDHQWGEFRAGVLDWEWFALQLDDGANVMLFQLKDHQGEDVYLGGTYSKDGRHHQLKSDDFALTALDKFYSEKTRTTYQNAWRIEIPEYGVDLQAKAVKANSEFDARKSSYSLYWEGPLAISGSHTGKAFLEVSKSSSAAAKQFLP